MKPPFSSGGISRVSRDDHEALERGALVYDALYAELKQGDAS